MQIVKGFIENIIFNNEENGYKIVEFNENGVHHTLVGEMGVAGVGDFVECEVAPVVHAVFGKQLKVLTCRILRPETAGQMEMYLASGAVKGIGASLAARIVKEFGEDTFRIMEEEPEQLVKIKGISQKKACDIGLSMQEQRKLRGPLIFLQDYGIVGALANKLVQKYGEDVYEIVRKNPYRLAEEVEGIGFKKADEIALKGGFEATSEYRIRCGILYVLMNEAQEGDCYVTGGELKRKLTRLLASEIPPAVFENELVRLQTEKRVYCMASDESMSSSEFVDAAFSDDSRVYEARLYLAEKYVAYRLTRLEAVFEQENAAAEDKILIEKEIDDIEELFHLRLADLQRKAVRGSLTNGVVLITGGPGTGKTTIIKAILRLFQERGMETALCAPTGRAAKRMTEVCGQEAKTIHRLLEVTAVTGEGALSGARFTRGEDNPLEVDAVIVDEMSMVDIRIFQSLLRAMTPGMRLIIVGDAAQLPSVGPGQVLQDLIDSKRFMTVTLEQIFRQEEASDIIVNAHRIHRGEQVDVDNRRSKDFFLMTRADAASVRSTLVQIVMRNLPIYLKLKPEQIQVLTPMRKGELGVEALNTLLQSCMNPERADKKEYSFGDKILREGDKVMQVKNNYQLEWQVYGRNHIVIERGKGVFNGDMGVIQRIGTDTRSIDVLFDDEKIMTYTFQEANELELAYAVTIHKSQGSEYPVIVMPLLDGPQMLMNRNLLYTGVTRAKTMVVIIGRAETVSHMIANETQSRRCTGLCDKIKREG